MRKIVHTVSLGRKLVSAELRCPFCKQWQRVRAESRLDLKRCEKLACPNCVIEQRARDIQAAAKDEHRD